MFSIWSFLITSFVLQAPLMFILAVFLDGIPGFAIANFWGPHYLEITAFYAITLFTYECIARMLSISFDNPLMGMLNYLQIWFTSFLFAGVMVPEDQVIWPFRVFFYIMPLKWSISSNAYLDAIDAEYEGATLCPEGMENDSDCLYHFTDAGEKIYPGWSCGANTTPQSCYGRTGTQILDSLGENYDVVSSENHLLMNFGVVISIGLAFQAIYMILASMKSSAASKITPRS